MRFQWRRDEWLASYDEWGSKIAIKDDAPGRSARSLAMAWAGPVCVAGALSMAEKLRDLRIETVSVEAQTAFDSFPGGKRNHDLLLTGVTSGGGAVVSIESKADESFGQTVRQYRDDGQRRRDRGETTNALERLEGLVGALIDHRSLADERVLALRYQLLTGVAGSVAAAVEHQANTAVFFIHEFVTDNTTEALRHKNAKDLYEFGMTVFDFEFPLVAARPWCVGPLRFAGNRNRLSSTVELYIAKAATDWRGDTKQRE
jgi:hypothetical protein